MQRQIEKHKELSLIYYAYQNILVTKQRYDYNDMILYVVEHLEEDENFQIRIAERFDYILVDEHQDTNRAQNNVLELLFAKAMKPNLFVVGDEKQAIFGFQGASLDNFLYFQNVFPKAKLIALKENYRSPQKLLDGALSMIGNNKKNISDMLTGISEELHAQVQSKTKSLNLQEFATSQGEHYFIGKKIQEFLKAKVPAQEIAILVREHRDAPPIARLLGKMNVPYIWESQQNMLEDRGVKSVLCILRYLANFGNEEKLLPVLHVEELGISAFDIYTLYATRVQKGVTPKPTMLELMAPHSHYSNIRLQNPEAITRVWENLNQWKKMFHNQDPLSLFESVVREGGFLKQIKAAEGDPRPLAGIQTLFSQLKKQLHSKPASTMEDFISYIDLVQDHNIKIKTETIIAPLHAVRLMTVHSAKGLEFDYVFVPNLYDAKWGGRIRPNPLKLPNIESKDVEVLKDNDAYEDERRIFFVALTRARKGAYISLSQMNEEGREQIPSTFLKEIPENLLYKNPGGTYDKEIQQMPQLLFAEVKSLPSPIKEREFIAELFRTRGLAVTALNNYLECPWKYFYVNLLRVPQAPTKHQLYGTAVHTALHSFF